MCVIQVIQYKSYLPDYSMLFNDKFGFFLIVYCQYYNSSNFIYDASFQNPLFPRKELWRDVNSRWAPALAKSFLDWIFNRDDMVTIVDFRVCQLWCVYPIMSEGNKRRERVYVCICIVCLCVCVCRVCVVITRHSRVWMVIHIIIVSIPTMWNLLDQTTMDP